MKHILTTILFIISLTAFCGDKYEVLGVWLIENKEAKVELYKTANGGIAGRIVWLKDMYDENGKPRTDVENDDERLRDRVILGMTIATGFVWNEQNQEWGNGKVYVPGNGNTYCGALKLKEDGTLYLRGYICGLRFLGKTGYCVRTKLSNEELALLQTTGESSK